MDRVGDGAVHLLLPSMIFREFRMVQFRRETATEKADLPHRFEERAATDVCSLCQSAPLDWRHTSWEKQDNLDTERASVSFARETGS